MATTAIFRQADKSKISSFNHLLNTQSLDNQEIDNNPNKNNANVVYIVDNDNNYHRHKFFRDGKNFNGVQELHQIANEINLLAHEDYKNHKLAEKKLNPDKKIRTVFQNPDLKKEFVIALGGDKKIGKQSDFESNVKKTVDAFLEKKQLERKNIIGIFIHYDEKTPHIHVQYNDYSFKNHTSSSQLERHNTKGLSKEQASELIKESRVKFGDYQDLIANNMGMERGVNKSKKRHTTKDQHLDNEYKQLLTEREAINKQCQQLTIDNNKLKLIRTKLLDDLEVEKLKLHDQRLNFSPELSANVLLKGLKKIPEFSNINESKLAEIYNSGITKHGVQPTFNQLKDKAQQLNDKVESLTNNLDISKSL